MNLKARKIKPQLSNIERFRLVGKLNSLPKAEYEQILIALGPPPGVIPAESASQGGRTFALFQWIEGPTGPGIPVLIELLRQVPNLNIDEIIEATTPRYRVVLDVDATTIEMNDLERVINGLSVLLGDDSIKLLDVKIGSLKIEITGTLDGLKSLENLFESKQLTEIEGVSIAEVNRIGNYISALQLGDQSWNQWRDEYPDIQVDLCGADFRDAFFNGINLSNASLRGSNLGNTSLRGADLKGANLVRAFLNGADLSGADLSGADLSEASFRDSFFKGTSIRQAILHRTDLSFSNLRGADLSRANLQEATLRGANLRGADLDNTNLRGANLRGADFDDASLRGANFDSATLRNASLERADLSNASFRNTDVQKSRFRANQGLPAFEIIKLRERGANVIETVVPQDVLVELLQNSRELRQDTKKIEQFGGVWTLLVGLVGFGLGLLILL